MSNFIQELAKSTPLLAPLAPVLEKALNCLISTYKRGGKVLTCGNGGSAADAEHIVAELMKGFLLRRPLPHAEKTRLEKGGCGREMITRLQRPISAISLVSGIAFPTAFLNDVDPRLIFAQQLLGLGKPEDTLIAISTSGNSPNVVAVCELANALRIPSIVLTGSNPCKLDTLASICIKAPSACTPKIQEHHIKIYHALCAELENRLFGADETP